MTPPIDVNALRQHARDNRALLDDSDRAGCFRCGALFSPRAIENWEGGREVESGDLADGDTALCPRCGAAAVLPSAAVELRPELLEEMRRAAYGG